MVSEFNFLLDLITDYLIKLLIKGCLIECLNYKIETLAQAKSNTQTCKFCMNHSAYIIACLIVFSLVIYSSFQYSLKTYLSSLLVL